MGEEGKGWKWQGCLTDGSKGVTGRPQKKDKKGGGKEEGNVTMAGRTTNEQEKIDLLS